MRYRGLSELKPAETLEVTLATLPEQVRMTRHALAKAFQISELVREIHKKSYEWYGFTLARRTDPELVTDILLPANDENLLDYTRVGPEAIAASTESLPRDQVVNGWIHSHGSLPHEKFSAVDDQNQAAVHDYVTSLLRKPVAKREIRIRDLTIFVKGRFTEMDLERGSVALITDAPVSEARIIETVYGSFCYAIVIGDSGWHRQEVHHRLRGILTGRTTEERRDAGLVLTGAEGRLTKAEIEALEDEVRTRIRPGAAVPEERFEKEAT